MCVLDASCKCGFDGFGIKLGDPLLRGIGNRAGFILADRLRMGAPAVLLRKAWHVVLCGFRRKWHPDCLALRVGLAGSPPLELKNERVRDQSSEIAQNRRRKHDRRSVLRTQRVRRAADQARQPSRRYRASRSRGAPHDPDDPIRCRQAERRWRPARPADPAHLVRHPVQHAALHAICAKARSGGQG